MATVPTLYYIDNSKHGKPDSYWTVIDFRMHPGAVEEELGEHCYYQWQARLVMAMMNGRVVKLCHTVSGNIGYMYRGRLISPAYLGEGSDFRRLNEFTALHPM